jgi:hypothetical protein
MLTYTDEQVNNISNILMAKESAYETLRAYKLYAGVCLRMLAYAGVCWRMLTYADVY